MPILPEILSSVAPYMNQLQQWWSEQMYAQMLRLCGEHILVQIHGVVDWHPLEQACESYHHQHGPGMKPVHNVARMVRILLVKYLFGWSLRRVEMELHYNLLVKWFVGYPLWHQLPDHTTLALFEQWVDQEQHRAYFDLLLTQMDACFPQLRDTVQIGDTFAMHANAARESLIELLRHTSQRGLAALKSADPQRYAQVLAQCSLEALYGTANEMRGDRLSESERQARLQTTVLGVLGLQQALRQEAPYPLPLAVQQRLGELDKILADEVHIEHDAQGQAQAVTELAAGKKGSYRIASATDTQATYRVHRTTVLGYNASLSITPAAIIREIQVQTGADPDANGVPRLISVQREQHGLCPPQLIYDQAASAGNTRAAVEQVSFGACQLVAHMPNPAHPHRFGPEDFTLLPDGATLTCPGGHVTTQTTPSDHLDGQHFIFKGRDCSGCPLWAACRGESAKPSAQRRVFISDYRAYVAQARIDQETAQFADAMRLRPRVERVIFLLTHYDHCRYAKRRGTRAADFLAKMAACVRNLRTWVKLAHSAPALS